MGDVKPICRRIRENLSAYFDGELKGDARRLIGDHLAECEECHKHYEELKETWQLLDELETPIVRRELSDELWTRIESERRAGWAARLERATGARGLRSGMAAALAVAVFLFGLYISGRPMGELPTPVERECIMYLDVLRNLDTLEHMEMVRHVRELGQDLAAPEPAEGVEPTEDSGV